MSLGASIWSISLLLFSCQPQEQPSSFGTTQDIQQHIVWTLKQQEQIHNHQRPAWMTTNCNAEPCFKEVWTSTKRTHTAYWSDQNYYWSEHKLFKTRWRGLNGVLLRCLGHPYSVPIALDPAGTRRYIEPDTWDLSLSGNNRCALSGTLQLATDKEKLNFKELRVKNDLWAQGGLEQARKMLLNPQASPK